jgi:CarD family transcriptional regulator
MFKAGDHIVYGTSGVCLVEQVCPSPFDKQDTRLFYVLRPTVGSSASLIYTPVENDRVPMRPVLTVEAVAALLARIHTIPTLTVAEERARRDAYRAALATATPEGYVAVIKTINGRRRDFMGTQRRLPEFELECESLARRHLFAELSLVLGKLPEEIGGYLSEDTPGA